MKNIWKRIVFEYNSIHNSVSFWYMKRKANRLHSLTGKRYHVIPSGERKLMVVDNRIVDAINRKLPKSKRINIKKLLESSYYSTPATSPFKK